jgi:predicted Zn finger-like uncharacterized protein
MLVKCPSCATTYKVADEILTGTTPAFRCSRCKHTFEGELNASVEAVPLPGEVESKIRRQKPIATNPKSMLRYRLIFHRRGRSIHCSNRKPSGGHYRATLKPKNPSCLPRIGHRRGSKENRTVMKMVSDQEKLPKRFCRQRKPATSRVSSLIAISKLQLYLIFPCSLC